MAHARDFRVGQVLGSRDGTQYEVSYKAGERMTVRRVGEKLTGRERRQLRREQRAQQQVVVDDPAAPVDWNAIDAELKR